MILVRKVDGPEAVEAGDSVIYRATEFNRPNPSEAEKANINWLVKCDGEELSRHERAGASLPLTIGDELVGKTLLVMPYANSPTPAVSAITLVRQRSELILRNGLDEIRQDFADILGPVDADLTDNQLADRVKDLKFAIDDLLDSAGPLGRDDEGDDEREAPDENEAKRLAIIVGHTANKRGAHAVSPLNQSEYPFNKEVARRMEQAASSRNISARTFFRDQVGISGAYQAAAAFQPQAIIELHFNAAGPNARGTESLCSAEKPESRPLADLVQQAMVRVFSRTGRANRGVKVLNPGDRGFRNVNQVPGIPSVLVEPFFGSNTQECRLAIEKNGVYAEALVDAFNNLQGDS